MSKLDGAGGGQRAADLFLRIDSGLGLSLTIYYLDTNNIPTNDTNTQLMTVEAHNRHNGKRKESKSRWRGDDEAQFTINGIQIEKK